MAFRRNLKSPAWHAQPPSSDPGVLLWSSPAAAPLIGVPHSQLDTAAPHTGRFCPHVLVCSGCHTQPHKLEGLVHRDLFSQFWSLEAQDQGVSRVKGKNLFQASLLGM